MRKTRIDKGINVNPNLPKDIHDKLFKLALSCGMSKTMLAKKIITLCVNHPDIIHHFQNQYNNDDYFRLTTIKIDGEIHYQ